MQPAYPGYSGAPFSRVRAAVAVRLPVPSLFRPNRRSGFSETPPFDMILRAVHAL